MTYEECLSKRKIVKEFDEISFTYKNITYSVKVGDVFERLKVVKIVQYLEGKTKRKGCICKCCCCENEYIGPSRIYMLISGELKSCGCYSREIHKRMLEKSNLKHGDSVREKRSNLYTLWAAMVDRATNKNRKDSIYYSMKGVSICEEWKEYEVFKRWALENGYVEGLSIDRKDNSKGYCPDNCRWIELRDQNKNKTNNRILEYNGRKMIFSDWCREVNVSWNILNNRIKKGMSIGQALGYE